MGWERFSLLPKAWLGFSLISDKDTWFSVALQFGITNDVFHDSRYAFSSVFLESAYYSMIRKSPPKANRSFDIIMYFTLKNTDGLTFAQLGCADHKGKNPPHGSTTKATLLSRAKTTRNLSKKLNERIEEFVNSLGYEAWILKTLVFVLMSSRYDVVPLMYKFSLQSMKGYCILGENPSQIKLFCMGAIFLLKPHDNLHSDKTLFSIVV